jgi:hypothetical protein
MKSEAAILNEIRLEASRRGWRLWRNNSGAYQDETGRLIRYGLANETAALNSAMKSGDLIGIAPRIIQAGDVGTVAGLFVSIEAKAEGWATPRDARERAQVAWRDMIRGLGGIAIITGNPREVF